MKQTKIVTFGEIMLRLSKPGYLRLTEGHLFEGHYGGSEANVAVSLAILGDDVEYVTRVPQNPIGDAALMHLRQFGLDVSHVVRGGDRLGTYYFERGAAMRNSMVVYDRKGSSFYSLERGMIPWDKIFQGAAFFHCSGITCAISRDAMDTTFDALRKAKELGVHITADINYRTNLWKFGLDPRDVLYRMLQYSEMIFGDQNEWEVASGVPQIPFTAKDSHFKIDRNAYTEYFHKMHKLFPRCKKMVLALRNQLSSRHHILTGLLYDVEQDHLYTSRIYDIQPIIDPMGVGDAFVAAYLHAFVKCSGDNQRDLDFSLSASALKNTITGDQNLVSEQEIIDNMTNSGGRIQR
ncbi:MAG: sugar kinase [Prevotella sp.]|nr:sugar kinase [Prevotella sp.]MCH3992561.1 sugar kinase [Prevotella sp.]MCH4019258.1 sugar kinase [Prevotella sp.]MCH4099114.1 sugar kinase [Prevotella sp.]MCI1291447.1 sugar kinase [Prevotella sp.]MCI1323727.1 sugar kinase [Prevotella sp.]